MEIIRITGEAAARAEAETEQVLAEIRAGITAAGGKSTEGAIWPNPGKAQGLSDVD